jgi:hypothetical protein
MAQLHLPNKPTRKAYLPKPAHWSEQPYHDDAVAEQLALAYRDALLDTRKPHRGPLRAYCAHLFSLGLNQQQQVLAAASAVQRDALTLERAAFNITVV